MLPKDTDPNPFLISASDRIGLPIAPVPPLDPFTGSINLKPLVVTVIVQVPVRTAPTESVTVIVGVAFACGFGQLISPVRASIVIPDGAFERLNAYGYEPPMTEARML